MFSKIIILFALSFCGVFGVDVKTSSGLVRGHTVSGLNNTPINEFLSIPYAEPPIGNLRFSKPLPLKEPRTLIDGTKLGVSCFQYGHSPKVPVNEDCLILNIWSPVSHNASDLKPVMLWIHGGGFYGGSSVEGTNGTFIASNDVVMVAINYRLGPFGFLYAGEESAPGNVGLYDQNMALKWVKQNIHLFGGNPNEITIFGESAGSWSVSSHVLSPVSKGLFKRAILQSGAVFNDKNAERLPKASALRQATQYAKHFNCSDDKWLECLRKVGAKELNAFVNMQPYAIFETDFLPLVAQKAFKAHNYSTDIDIIAGVMQREGSSLAHGSMPQSEHLKSAEEFGALVKKVYFPELKYDKIIEFYLKNVNTSDSVALKKAFYEFYGDVYITCSTYHFAKQFAEYSPKRNAFFYEFTYPVSANDMGATHGSDVGLVFGYAAFYKSHDKQLSADLMKMWTNFAKYGEPLKEGFPSDHVWPRFIDSTGTGATKAKEMNPAQPNHIIDNIMANTCDGFWKDYFV